MSLASFELHNRTILVTGATGDLGCQIALTLSEAGAVVVLTGRNEARLNDILGRLKGEGHRVIPADLTQDEEIIRVAQETPAVDGVVHAAGIVDMFPTKFLNKKRIDITFSINFNAPVLLMTALFKHKKIREKTSVVFLSSLASSHPYTSGAMYAASKAALEAYAKVLAAEHARIGLRANSVAPAIVNTRLFEETKSFVKTIKESSEVDSFEENYLFGYGEPQDVANLVLFLISDASKWMTGEVIQLDGGFMRGIMS